MKQGNFKGFKIQIEILAVVFDWLSKQQLSFWLFLLDWYCRKLELTGLPGHNGKVTSNKKMIFISHRMSNVGNKNYCSHFSVIFEATSNIPINFLRLLFEKAGVDRVTGPQQEIDIRYESDLKVILNGLGCK